MTKSFSSERGQCHGIVNDGHGVKAGDRCKRYDNNDERYNLCQNENRDMCYMHCDCDYCSSKYTPTKNKGIRYSPKKLELPDFLWKEKDIVKLQCLLQAISEEQSLNPFVKRTKEIYLKRNVVIKLQSKLTELEIEVRKIRREINEV